MPSFRPLSAEQVGALQKRRRRPVDLTEYSQFVRTLAVGDGGEVTLGPSEQKRAVKRRLTLAARQLGMDVHYRWSEGNVLRFEVRALPPA